ncbi:MAG: hypothetical protein NPIRA05_14900 [Nitrospirales bacterium]|nr:MAG: hypothetical protein NPIRA05_14900 [Nitrospirales bacterium]
MTVSLQHQDYWELEEGTFDNTPNPQFYFPSAKHEEGLHRSLYGLTANKGAVLISGEIGCGKTLLSRELILKLPKDRYDIALIANPTFGADQFLKEVLYQLGLQAIGSKIEMLHQLNDHLLKNSQNGISTVVMVDEAQAIQDEKIFEELRLLLNFQLNDRFLLTLVLLGQPELQDRLMAIPQLSQRIAVRSHLISLNEEETAAYVQFRLKVAGCQVERFTEEALTMIFQQTGGVPRRINTLCDWCLLLGYMERAKKIDRAVVTRAINNVL